MLFKKIKMFYFVVFFCFLGSVCVGAKRMPIIPCRMLVNCGFKRACESNDAELVSKYVKYGMDVDIGVVYALASGGASDSLSCLIKSGADVNRNVMLYRYGFASEFIKVPLLVAAMINQDIKNVDLILNHPQTSVDFIRENWMINERLFVGRRMSNEIFSLLESNMKFSWIAERLKRIIHIGSYI